MAAAVRLLALTTLWLTIFVGSLELGLRALPQVIPLEALRYFDPDLRSEIAARRDLTRLADTVLLPRDDGGPPERMRFYKPGSELKTLGKEEGMREAVVTDQNGLCNTPFDAYSSPRFDLIAIGDSFAWCTGVEPRAAWPARLGALTGLSSYNAGMPGHGPYEYLQSLKHFGLAKRPAAVVMSIYEGNDFRDAHKYHRFRNDPASEAAAAVCSFSGALPCAVQGRLARAVAREHSYAYNLLWGGLYHLTYNWNRNQIDFRYAVELPDGERVDFGARALDKDDAKYAQWLVEGQLGTELLDGALQELAGLAERHGFMPIVVLLPSHHSAYAQMIRFDGPGLRAWLEGSSRMLREYLARKGEELDFRFIDATPDFQRASAGLPSGHSLYFRSNVHLTREGHEVVARLLARELSDLGVGARGSGG